MLLMQEVVEEVTELAVIIVMVKAAIMLAATKSLGIIVLLFLLIGTCFRNAQAEEHDATVTTASGSYSVPVEVEDGEVTQVHWPNGGDMNLNGADISDGEAEGTNSRGESVSVALDNYEEPKADDEETKSENEN